MDIDFHHGVTYLLARLSGFNPGEADIIARSCQYVDDATYDDDYIIRFDNGAMYKPVCSAHKALDYRNVEALDTHPVWLPYHFLPANVQTGPSNHPYSYASRFVCQPNSALAQEMVNECIRRRNEPNALHRLGITMHVYADTWAHRGFAGIAHEINQVEYLEHDDLHKSLKDKVIEYFGTLFDHEQSRFVDNVLPLGHGPVLSYPDRPYLTWSYIDSFGKPIDRNNPLEYLDAANHMVIAMKRFRLNNPAADITGLEEEHRGQLLHLLQTIEDHSAEARHRRWLDLIHNGDFHYRLDQHCCPPEPDKNYEHGVYHVRDDVQYTLLGEDSWDFQATEGFCFLEANILKLTARKLKYQEKFLGCNWKQFHDALHDHQYFVKRSLFPRFGLCAI